MATPVFPISILPPSQSGYSAQYGTEFIQIELDGGESRTVRNKLGVPHIVNCMWQCTPTQYTTIHGFWRDRCQSGTRSFIIPLLIDTPTLVPYRARFAREPQKLSQTEGHMHSVTATLEVIPNPMVSFDMVCQRVSDERVIANNNPDFQPTIFAQFPIGRNILLTGCSGLVNGIAVNLDGTYAVLSKPSDSIIVLNNAAAVNADWTVLAGTLSKTLFPTDNAGACILLPT